MANVMDYVPNATGAEYNCLMTIMAPMRNEQAFRFSSIYNTQRRNYTLVLVLCLLGFLPTPIGGIHRFAMNDIGMGILCILTGGLCLIGTIMDLINLKSMVDEYNIKVAQSVKYRMDNSSGVISGF